MSVNKLLALAAFFQCAAVFAGPMPVESVPDPLKTWVPWVLHGRESLKCPQNFAGIRECVWPSRLSLQAADHSGQFRMEVQVFGATAAVELPGEAEHWPQEVKAGNLALPVVARNSRPAVVLAPGTHVLTGLFAWKQMPQNLLLPKASGILQLTVLGKNVTPQMDAEGRIWLQQATQQAESQDALFIRTYRLVRDEIPLRVTTRFDLSVSGKPREIELNSALLEGFVPESISSALPARLDKGGSLKVQARAGNWPVEISGRLMSPAKVLVLPKTVGSNEEIWSFQAQNELRMVTVEGVSSVDPRQASMPEAWKQYPAYRMRAGETMKLNESKRGNPLPNPDKLSIARELWLDFNGAGATIKDRITGTLSRSWRLEMAAPAVLGRASVGGIDQPVTRREANGPLGIEVRQGTAGINADSRIDDFNGTLPAAGWLSDVNALSIQLNLPPAWRLFHATGVDKAGGSWVAKWTLWDFFFVLLSALAAFKLLGWRTGALLGAALVVSWHMPEAPQLIWIALLAFLALYRVLPEGWFKKLANWGKYLCLALLLFMLVPYAVDQVRMSLYPSLESSELHGTSGFSWPGLSSYKMDALLSADVEGGAAPLPPPAPAPAEDGLVEERFQEQQAYQVERKSMAQARSKLRAEARLQSVAKAGKMAAPRQLDEIDPDAKVQTGPGLPAWRWRTHRLSWQGPVEKAQQLHLYLMPPAVTILWRLASVALMVLALLALFGRLPKIPLRSRRTASALAALIALFLLVPLAHASTKAPPVPPPPPSAVILDELRDRLMAPPDCAPNCAEWSRLLVSAEGGRVQLRLEVQAQAEVMLPLPGKVTQWLPSAVTVDGKPAVLRRADSGTLWLALDQGVHQIVLDSEVGTASMVQIALPMPVRALRSELKGWTLSGLDAREMASGAISLTREAVAGKAEETGTQRDALPPLVQVERTVCLGLKRTLETRIVRVAPSRAPIAVKIQLLEGESVNDSSVRVEKGTAIIQLAGEDSLSFVSTLSDAPKLKLVSSKEAHQIEVWTLDASTLWHVRLGGIPPVLHQSGDRWMPRWQPWPGEEVTVDITRPAGEAGQTLTADKVLTQIKPGQRATDVTAEISLRSSQGGNHSFELPEGAQLMEVTVKGLVQPIQAEGRKVTVPLVPGAQIIKLGWREGRGMEWLFRTRSFGVGASGVNDSLNLDMPEERVILSLGGPRLGPAVLFWGVLVIILGIALYLGRSGLTPLGVLSWFLLGAGLAQSTPMGAAVVGGWFLVLAARQRWKTERRWGFNIVQVLLVVWTLAAAGVIFETVQTGLLGHPDMMIEGNGSSASSLNWYQDRIAGTTEEAWVLSVPVLWYRGLMLIWALWLAASLLKWVKWAWECFGQGGYWRRRKKAEINSSAAEAPERVDASSETEPSARTEEGDRLPQV
ncbi:MAG: hypothetical protein BWY57_01519 [Betaproteobacteria bacterium ADurb.Bin341]|nr:MAG: hypothetical protein BWY57_01519 [Betaproteobacteria bacterium ADurb.Bin341]